MKISKEKHWQSQKVLNILLARHDFHYFSFFFSKVFIRKVNALTLSNMLFEISSKNRAK